MTETLSQKQRRFMRSLGLLLAYVNTLPGHEVAGGELERRDAEAKLNAAQGDGIAESLHKIRLAIDLHLFINGVYQTTSEAHAPLGRFWKSLGADHYWGGDFKPKPDGNHYSIGHGGRK